MGPALEPSVNGKRNINHRLFLSTGAPARILVNKVGFSESEKLKIEKQVAAVGGEALFFDETASTNTVLRGMAEQGAREGTSVFADTQTGGRGRMGRKWISPAGGNVFMSVLLRPHVAFSKCPAATFMASLALCATFREAGIEPEIKWPNDILVGGSKIAGVLSEAEPEGNMCGFIVIGIGVNLNLDGARRRGLMESVALPAVSAAEVLGRNVDRGDFTAALVGHLFTHRADFESKGPDWTVAQWAVEWGKLNTLITVDGGSGKIEGIARKVDGGGFLHIETADGELVRIVSGDTA